MTKRHSSALIGSEKEVNHEDTSSPSNIETCSLVSISWCNAGDKEWHCDEKSTHEISSMKPENTSLFPQDCAVGIIKANAREIKKCKKCLDYFMKEFEMPKVWWTSYCKRSNGYVGFEETYYDEGSIAGLNIWTLFISKYVTDEHKTYAWDKLNFFVRWIPEKKRTVIIMFDPLEDTAKSLHEFWLDSMTVQKLKDPLWMYDSVMEEVVHLQNRAVSIMRDLVRDLEKNRPPNENPKPNFEQMHEISRHVTHVSETLDLAVKSVRVIIARHERLLSNGQAGPAGNSVHDRLLFFEQMISSLGMRSASNKERLRNEIQLAFNMVAQYDSRTAVQIGQAAKIDSAAMKTIAFVTLTFLPATFISAIFSMSFFNFDAGTGVWTVSKKFWLYWVIAVPVTALTFLFWNLWWRQFPPTTIGRVENEDLEHHLKHRILYKKLLDFLKKGDDDSKV